MTLKVHLIAYLAGWEELAEIEREELRRTPIEMKWKQLNLIIPLAIGLGIFKRNQAKRWFIKVGKATRNRAKTKHQNNHTQRHYLNLNKTLSLINIARK